MKPEEIPQLFLDTIEKNSQLMISLGEDAKEQFKGLLEAQMNEAGFVSREEFDALRASLDRALERLESLENQLAKEN